MSDSFSKKEKIKKREKKKQDKAQKMEDRKTDNNKGKSLESMMVYVDHLGNFTSVPPDQQVKIEIDPEEIQLGAAPVHEEPQGQKSGTVSTFFADKGYGFIIDDQTKESIFVHSNQLSEPIKERDKVLYDKERTSRGLTAINVKKK